MQNHTTKSANQLPWKQQRSPTAGVERPSPLCALFVPSDLVEESAVSLMMKGRCDSVGPQNGATVELVGALVLEKILRLLWICKHTQHL